MGSKSLAEFLWYYCPWATKRRGFLDPVGTDVDTRAYLTSITNIVTVPTSNAVSSTSWIRLLLSDMTARLLWFLKVPFSILEILFPSSVRYWSRLLSSGKLIDCRPPFRTSNSIRFWKVEKICGMMKGVYEFTISTISTSSFVRSPMCWPVNETLAKGSNTVMPLRMQPYSLKTNKVKLQFNTTCDNAELRAPRKSKVAIFLQF